MSDGVGSNDSLDASVFVDRARSEERSGPRERGPSRRSKSEGPPGESEYRTRYLSPKARLRNMRCDNSEQDASLVMIATVQPSGGALKNAISRISTEYRLQFAWPKGSKERTEDKNTGPPRKSLSMGAIKPTGNIMPLNSAIAAVHKKRITDADRKFGAELEPLVGWGADSQDDGYMQDDGGEEKIQEESLSKEEKKLSRAEFNSEYTKKFRPFSQYEYVEGKFKAKEKPEPILVPDGDSWYREVLELRKKAGEYKHRGWGTELVPQHIAELYNKQMTLWEQVSRRSSLSALSLASTTPRSISKEEKEKENNKKSSPTKPPWSRQSPSRHISPQKKVEKSDDNRKESVRSRKEAGIRHHLERTTGAVDGALLQSPTREKLEPVIPRRKEDNPEVSKNAQKSSHYTSGRSQSVGPTSTYSGENRSPKRSARGGQASSKVQANGPISEKRTRPTTLTTTAPSRTKSSSGSRRTPKSATPRAGFKPKEQTTSEADNVDGVNEPEEPEPIIDLEPVVKSPPEPTRVKSPEQILMRSPEPVNWTVPLDTGKTFTVTQNVHEGDLITRPHSEIKAWTPPAAPPLAPQSAPPQLPEPEGEPSNPSSPPQQTGSPTPEQTGLFEAEMPVPLQQPVSV